MVLESMVWPSMNHKFYMECFVVGLIVEGNKTDVSSTMNIESFKNTSRTLKQGRSYQCASIELGVKCFSLP